MSSCVGVDFNEELTCPLCLDAWRDPVELAPCGHIFCTDCTKAGGDRFKSCPVCRTRVQTFHKPHRTLTNMALRVRVKCTACEWTGTREDSARHTCDGATAGVPATAQPVWGSVSTELSVGSSMSISAPVRSPSSMTALSSSVEESEESVDPWQRLIGTINDPARATNEASSSDHARVAFTTSSASREEAEGERDLHSGFGAGGDSMECITGGVVDIFELTPSQAAARRAYLATRESVDGPARAHDVHLRNAWWGPTSSVRPPAFLPAGAPTRLGGSMPIWPSTEPVQESTLAMSSSMADTLQRRLSSLSLEPAIIRPYGDRPWELYDLDRKSYTEITTAFARLDADHDGSLTLTEATRLTRWLNLAHTPGQVSCLVENMDVKGDGKLTFSGLLTWMRAHPVDPEALYDMSCAKYKQYVAQFHQHDKNYDGWLVEDEFLQLCTVTNTARSASTARRLFVRLSHGRGRLDLHAFLTFRAKFKRKGALTKSNGTHGDDGYDGYDAGNMCGVDSDRRLPWQSPESLSPMMATGAYDTAAYDGTAKGVRSVLPVARHSLGQSPVQPQQPPQRRLAAGGGFGSPVSALTAPVVARRRQDDDDGFGVVGYYSARNDGHRAQGSDTSPYFLTTLPPITSSSPGGPMTAAAGAVGAREARRAGGNDDRAQAFLRSLRPPPPLRLHDARDSLEDARRAAVACLSPPPVMHSFEWSSSTPPGSTHNVLGDDVTL